ncbi:Lipopolysaccharide kinase (Kdo/WaaP) family protein [Austwickia chelonae]|uniref:DUF4032 domain-containing protein n=1 Tax=Austwickia chelonae NBRC 105200 TaxID=1184607 RepID=K6W7N2_9MICO|nr:DUF4032 domain-containing protein [Austwickia chelonae]GAB77837.1 hypothetical protein AUCHE_08_00790 [Austwickia chelonae NBRC 105200]SEV90524.1 Lipopolysaccharide kinase (Kdo/WaaP) family protein [Austwickia chelonae]
MPLQITAARPDPALLDLPWSMPLEEWHGPFMANLPRGISRHVVRFVKVSGRVLAVKEIKEDIARREYHTLRSLRRMEQPTVKPFGVISGRTTPDGEPLDACLLTRHLKFALPYRALFSQRVQPDTTRRLLDALAVLLVRLHLEGFWWGDVSLSNTLFRRDAGSFSAYLVDAETGQLLPSLSDGQRAHDLDIARVNIAGEFMDLEALGCNLEDLDPIAMSDRVVHRYEQLWEELTGIETLEPGERWRMDERIRRLNKLGFDVDELSLSTSPDDTTIQIQPKVVDAGHHCRRLMRLTGLDVQENQARRLLNDLDSYRMGEDRQGDNEELVAHDWMARVYEPIVSNIPPDLQAKLEPAEVFHEVLEHRWYMSERAGHDVTTLWAFVDYLNTVLPKKRDEEAIVGVDTVETPVVATFDD